MNLFEILSKWPGIYDEARADYEGSTKLSWDKLCAYSKELWVRKVVEEKKCTTI